MKGDQMKHAIVAGLLVVLSACTTQPAAETPVAAPFGADEEAVLKVVDTFLLAVGNGDRELQKSVELPDGGLAVYRAKDGVAGPVRRMPASDFQKPTPDHDPFVEMYWDPQIDLRGSFAQVWSRYMLTDNGAIVHCGINAFQLVKLEGAWKIHSALSSMEAGACDELGAKTATGLRPRDGWRETPSQ